MEERADGMVEHVEKIGTSIKRTLTAPDGTQVIEFLQDIGTDAETATKPVDTLGQALSGLAGLADSANDALRGHADQLTTNTDRIKELTESAHTSREAIRALTSEDTE